MRLTAPDEGDKSEPTPTHRTMITRLTFAVGLAAVLTLSACDLTGSDTIQLRIENTSSIDFASVAVGIQGERSFGAVSSGSVSAYQEVEQATESANIDVIAAGEQYLILPFHDGYGEILEGGRYTYVLDIDESRLALRLERN